MSTLNSKQKVFSHLSYATRLPKNEMPPNFLVLDLLILLNFSLPVPCWVDYNPELPSNNKYLENGKSKHCFHFRLAHILKNI